MSFSLTLNGLRARAVHLLVPWRGAWEADCVLDPDDVATVPTSGPASLVVGDTTFTASVDPRASGTFLTKASVRVIGGAGGWSTTVPRQTWTNSGGVSTLVVDQATAQLVGETLSEPSPAVVGTSYIRTTGPARRIFRGRDWWVDFTGVTNVGSRPTPAPPDALQILDWDPLQQRADFTCDATPLVPGTVLSDPRFNGVSPVVREVEQNFTPDGSTGSAWCSSTPSSRLSDALANMLAELGGLAYLQIYRYRCVQSDGANLVVQGVTAGAPDIGTIVEGTGMSGVQAKLTPGTLLYIGFIAGSPADPIVLGYAPTTPTELDLCGGDDFVVKATPYTDLLAALAAFASALNTATTLSNVIAAGTALNTALGLLPPPATTLTKAT